MIDGKENPDFDDAIARLLVFVERARASTSAYDAQVALSHVPMALRAAQYVVGKILSEVEMRWLRVSAAGLDLSADENSPLEELCMRREVLLDACLAAQSLDSLGSDEATRRSIEVAIELERRLARLDVVIAERKKKKEKA